MAQNLWQVRHHMDLLATPRLCWVSWTSLWGGLPQGSPPGSSLLSLLSLGSGVYLPTCLSLTNKIINVTCRAFLFWVKCLFMKRSTLFSSYDYFSKTQNLYSLTSLNTKKGALRGCPRIGPTWGSGSPSASAAGMCLSLLSSSCSIA